ncbi:hypothetical protein EAF00_007856 [Botryotinia globosa]|nr:hypothetical protein EAF00_007856 [Botryotinia globosa]
MESHKDAAWNEQLSDLSKEEMCLMIAGRRVTGKILDIRVWIAEQRVKRKEVIRDRILNSERDISTEESTLYSSRNNDTNQARQRKVSSQSSDHVTSQARQRKVSSQSSDHATSQAPQPDTLPSSNTARPTLLTEYIPPITQICLGVLMFGGFWYYGIGISSSLACRTIGQAVGGQTGSLFVYKGFYWTTAALKGSKNMIEEDDPSSSSSSSAEYGVRNECVNSNCSNQNLIANE